MRRHGTTWEAIAGFLRKLSIRVAPMSKVAWRSIVVHPKDLVISQHKNEIVYRMLCGGCDKVYSIRRTALPQRPRSHNSQWCAQRRDWGIYDEPSQRKCSAIERCLLLNSMCTTTRSTIAVQFLWMHRCESKVWTHLVLSCNHATPTLSANTWTTVRWQTLQKLLGIHFFVKPDISTASDQEKIWR